MGHILGGIVVDPAAYRLSLTKGNNAVTVGVENLDGRVTAPISMIG